MDFGAWVPPVRVVLSLLTVTWGLLLVAGLAASWALSYFRWPGPLKSAACISACIAAFVYLAAWGRADLRLCLRNPNRRFNLRLSHFLLTLAFCCLVGGFLTWLVAGPPGPLLEHF